MRQLPEIYKIIELDPRDPDALEEIAELAPEAVIIDADDDELAEWIPLSRLLSALPKLTIIRLDPKSDQIQVVTSEQRQAGTMDDLVEAIAGRPEEL